MADMLAHRQEGRLTGVYINKQKETGAEIADRQADIHAGSLLVLK